MRLVHLFLIALLATLLSGSHVLHHFSEHIEQIKTHTLSGDTSRVFSIVMKMLLQTKTLYD